MAVTERLYRRELERERERERERKRERERAVPSQTDWNEEEVEIYIILISAFSSPDRKLPRPPITAADRWRRRNLFKRTCRPV
jgi:hypothetical protein